jgi:hypothetical protein
MGFLFVILPIIVVVIIYKLIKELTRMAADAAHKDAAKDDSWIKAIFKILGLIFIIWWLYFMLKEVISN